MSFGKSWGGTCAVVVEKLWRRKEYTLGHGTLSFLSNVDFELQSSKVGVYEIDSCDVCIAIWEGKGTVGDIQQLEYLKRCEPGGVVHARSVSVCTS